MKYLVLFALFALAFADDAPTPVEDTPEVAMAKADHLKAVEYQKALIASVPKEVPFPYYSHPLAYGAAVPYSGYYPYQGYYPYSHFNYGYSAVAPAYTPYSYPYAYPYTYPFAVKAKTE